MCQTCSNVYKSGSHGAPRISDVETPLLGGSGSQRGGRSGSPEDGGRTGSEKGSAVSTSAPSHLKSKGPAISAVFIVASITLITVLVAILTNALVTAIFPVSTMLGISPDFIAVILLPVVGNAAELATATMAAQRDNLDLSIAVALGSATQISLLLVPASVLFGWAIGVPMTLDFQPTFALVFFGSVLAVAVLTMDGESHWLKGVVLLGVYGTVAVGMAAAPGAAGVDSSSQVWAHSRTTLPATASVIAHAQERARPQSS